MATRKAITVVGEKTTGVTDVPIPKPGPDWVLTKVKAVSLNPTDWKHVEWGAADTGAILGCDYYGIVEEVGSNVTKFKKGDRIAGFTHGGDRTNHNTGSYSEYCLGKAGNAMVVPDNVTDIQAATLGVATVTVGQGLYKSLKLPLPSQPAKEPFPILINGGSTSMGVYGIQFAKLSGLTVIVTASPHNFDYVRSLGADAVFDYRSPTVAADIRAYTKNKLRYAWDCVGGKDATALVAGALSDQETSYLGDLATLDKELCHSINPKVDGPHLTLGYDAVGEPFLWDGKERVPDSDELQFSDMFWGVMRDALARGAVKPPRIEVNRGGSGFEGIRLGMSELQAGKVSALKLVYTLDEQ